MPTSTTTSRQEEAGKSGGLRKRIGAALVALGSRLGGETPVPTRQEAPRSDRFASLASMIPGVVYQRIVSPDGDIRYTYISEGARDMFGVAPEDVLSDPEALFRTYSDDYKANFRQRLITASQSLETWDVEASIVGADGNIRYTHAIAKPERLPDGSTLWTGLILDATRIKLVEEQLKAANRSVEAANRAKSLFLANMSHEIRTPMNGVLGMADLLLKTALNQRQSRLLNTLRHSAKTLLGIINDVLDISRIEAGRFDLEHEPFDLRSCLEDAIDLCAGAAYVKGLEIGLLVSDNLPNFVVGDVGRLRQVLINLLANAVKFTEKGSATLRVEAGPPRDGKATVVFKVIDTGIGIPAAARETLFSPFSQADSSISRKFGGTGLGLAITRHLVTLMGGRVDLDSEVGRGTCVTVEIPYAVHEGAETEEISLPQLAGTRILIADNRAVVRETLASMMEGTGADLEFAGDELETVSLLRHAAESGRPYDLIIVDRIRPQTDSIEFSRSIEQDPLFRSTRIIKIVSMMWKGALAGEGAGNFGVVLPKPVRRVDLMAAITSQTVELVENEAGDTSAAPLTDTSDIADPDGDTVSGNLDLGLRILLAEDNPVNQEVALEYLRSFGCAVEIANNGEEAVAMFEPGRFDVVLMDCQMPIMDGLTAVRSIRQLELVEAARPTPIIAVTANAYESDRRDATDAGMNDYLVKPFSDDGLLEMLTKWRNGVPVSEAA